MKFDDAFFRIQDGRYPLPSASTNWRNYESDEEMNGVSAFIDLVSASKDLLGHQSADGWGNSYAEAVVEAGGYPMLCIFSGEIVEEDVGAGVVVDPKRKSERRFGVRNVWAAWLRGLIEIFPEDKFTLAKWSRTIDGWSELSDAYELDDVQEEVFRALYRRKRT